MTIDGFCMEEIYLENTQVSFYFLNGVLTLFITIYVSAFNY